MAVEKDVDLTSKTTSKKYTDLCLSKIYKNELACLKLFVPQTHKARLGENVQIPCSFSVDKSPVDRSLLKIIWYFQGKQVLSVEDKSKETIDPRLSYVDKASDGNADLHISNTLLSDGGLYKCSVIYSNQRKEAEVRLDIQASPQVTITDNTVVLNAESILRCSATGFYPVDIDIKWFRGSERLSDVTEDLPLRNQDGLYSVNSTVTITPTEEDRKQNFSCRVQHESLQQPHQETFQLLYGAMEAVLHLTPTEEIWGKEVSCVVEHNTLLRPKVESLTVLQKDSQRNYLFAIVAVVLCVLLAGGTISFYVYRYRQKRHPKLRNITPSADGSFSLNVDHFYPEEILVTWEIFQPPSSRTSQTLQSIDLMQENQDGTYNVISTTESLRGKVDESEKYSLCAAVTHRKLRHPSYREWTNQHKDNTSFQSPPELGEILAPSLMLSSPAQLQCTISRFYPDHLTVKWVKKVKGNEEIIKTCEKYKITPHRSLEQRDKTFTCTAGLTLTPTLEDQGSEIICRVTHPGLERPAERSTGQLQVRVKPTSERPIQLVSITDFRDVTAALSLLNFYPKDIKIIWSCGRSQEKKPSEEKTTDNPDGTFSINTKCNIPGEIFNQKDWKIKVTWKHETMDKEEIREMCVGKNGYPWCPKIVEMSPLILQMGKQTTVTCKILKFFPDNLTVTWYKKTGGSVTQCGGDTYKISSASEKSEDNSYSCLASLSFLATSQPEDPEIICNVSHPSLKDAIEQSTGKALMRVIPQMEKPVTFTLNKAGRVRCCMGLAKFHPSDIKITWMYKEIKLIPSTRKLIQTDGEQTFNATSECEVPLDHFTSGVRVTWEHESMTSPQNQDLRVKDFPWRPVIEEIVKPVFLVDTEATLQCKISQYFPNNLTVTWYKKKLGNQDEIGKTTPTAERQPDRTYICTVSLTLTPSIDDDGAEFICRAQHPSLEECIQQTTGPIQVYASPRMQGPIQWSIGPGGDVLCTLYLQSFYPKSIEIRWSCGTNHFLESNESYEDNGDSTLNVRSECRVSQQNIDVPDFRITVTWNHKSLDKLETREVYIRDAGLPWRPTVSEIFTSIMRLNEEVTLRCDISGYFPQNLTMSWLVKERGRNEYTPAPNIYQYKMTQDQYSDSGYRSTASLHFSPSLSRHHGVWIMCKVTHPSLDAPIERSAGPLLISLTPELREAPIITPCGTDEVLCSVKIRKFYPKIINVNWTNGKSCVMTSKTIVLVNEDEEEAYDAISECRIPQTQLRFPLRVTWEHESMAEPESVQLKETDLPWRPVIEDIDKPDFFVNTEATLQCKISQYFPNNLTVTWYKKKKGNQDVIGNTTPIAERQPDNTYSCTASLTVTPSIEDDGAEFICRAQHPSLEQHIQQTTGPIQVYASPRMQGPIQWSIGPGGDVLCTLYLQSFYPKSIDIRWSCGADSSVESKETYEDNTDATHNVRSNYRVPQQKIHGSSLRLTVTWSHKSVGKVEMRDVYIRNAVPPKPREELIITPCGTDEVLCSVKIRKFFPKKITVKWIQGESSVMTSKTIVQVNEEEEEAYDAISECRIPQTKLRFPLRVTWEHESMEKPGSIQLKETDLPWHPVIGEIDKPDFFVKTEATLQCKISQYFPNNLTVTWYKKKKKGNQDVILKTTPIAERQPDNTYSCIASLTVTPSIGDNGAEYICRAQHPSLEQHIQQTTGPIQVYASPQMQGPIQWSIGPGGDVLCTLYLQSFYPKSIDIRWSCSADSSVESKETYEDNTDATHNVRSNYRVPQQRIHGSSFRITVTWSHKSLREAETREVYIKVAVPPKPREELLITPYGTDQVLCSVKIRKFFPKKIMVKWIQGESSVMTSKTIVQVNEEEEEAYDAISECRILLTQLRFPLRVTWEHESMEIPESVQLKETEFSWHPTLSDIHVPVLTAMNESELQCRISGYFPDAVTVSWYKKGNEQMEFPHNKTSVTKSERLYDSTLSCTARLQFTPTTSDRNSEIICRVEHPSLETPLEKSSGPLQVRRCC
ncbi:uncharacterized protein LOC142246771 [Anomaloglossus baeobatrachus]|uniref:uncharacterized protein LOC142246771 n=1 Tax=Anomaloglossus baeobatrachus TaxID=238106 RepID=UPI003F4F7C27